MKSEPHHSTSQTSSRSPGNGICPEDAILALAVTSPREAMFAAADYFGDGSSCSATACNIAVSISYARYIEGSTTEQEYVCGLPQWVKNAPDMSDALFVALRLRYWAWETKTAAYERARVHASAMQHAYKQGIQPNDVRAYLEAHSLEGLYAWTRGTDVTGSEVEAELAREVTPIMHPPAPNEPYSATTLIASGDSDLPSDREVDRDAPASAPPLRKPPKVPRYDGEGPEGLALHVLISKTDFDFVMQRRGRFALQCHCEANGRSTWVRVRGALS